MSTLSKIAKGYLSHRLFAITRLRFHPLFMSIRRRMFHSLAQAGADFAFWSGHRTKRHGSARLPAAEFDGLCHSPARSMVQVAEQILRLLSPQRTVVVEQRLKFIWVAAGTLAIVSP